MKSHDTERFYGATTMIGVSAAICVAAGYLRYGWMIAVRVVALMLWLMWALVAHRYLDRIRPKSNLWLAGFGTLLLTGAAAWVCIHPLIRIGVKALLAGVNMMLAARLPLIFKKRKETET